MTGLEQLAVVAAGFGAGIMTSTVGVASLLSFPVLVARRAAAGRRERLQHRRHDAGRGERLVRLPRASCASTPCVTALVIVTCAVGSVAGAILLLALPPEVFEAVVPWLILFTCLLVGAQPTLEEVGTPPRRDGPQERARRTCRR